jgi:putative drug exporter of the RND superfamily
VLALAASLGLTAYLFQDLLGYAGITYYIPFAAAVLLVSLGSDYNIFVVGRIWSEARVRPLREAIAVAGPRAARTITVAGVVLAGSFAVLALVPLQQFREFAFVMTVGILLDTFVVRSLLVPSLIALFGTASWWPWRGPRAAGAPARDPERRAA